MTLLALSHTSITDPSDPESRIRAHVHPHNILDDAEPLPELGRDTLCVSGHLATPHDDGTVPPSPATWSAPGWNAFEAASAELNARADRSGTTLILRPNARHVLADPQSTLAWLKRTEPTHTRVLLDPSGWLTPSMLPDAPDHLARTFGAFAGHPAVWGVLLTALIEAPSGELAPAPLHTPDADAALGAGVLLEAFAPFPRDGLPVVLLDQDLDLQRGVLERAGAAEHC